MKGSSYTKEQNDFLCDNYNQFNYSQLSSFFNSRFNCNKTKSAIMKKCKSLGLPAKEKVYKSLFTEEIDKFISENAFDYTSGELSEKIFEKFGVKCAKQTVTDRILKLGIRRGNRYVPKDYIPASSKEIGSERIDKNRTVMVKTAQPNVWKTKASVLMGYDSEQFIPIFVDGNSLNVTKENIIVVSKKIHARLAKNGWLNNDRRIIEAGIKWSELLYAIKDLM